MTTFRNSRWDPRHQRIVVEVRMSPTRDTTAVVNPPWLAAANRLLHGSLEGEDEDGEDEDNDKIGADLKSNSQAKDRLCSRAFFMISDIQWARSSNMRAAMAIFDATLLKNCYLSVLDDMDDEFLNDYCKSAEVHCQVRQCSLDSQFWSKGGSLVRRCLPKSVKKIQEVMESFKVEFNGKTIPVKAVRNISGHNILRYKIHGDKQIPFVKMQIWKKVMYSPSKPSAPRARESAATAAMSMLALLGFIITFAKSLLKIIDDNFGTLVFSRRSLEYRGVKNYYLGIRSLDSKGIVESYAPMVMFLALMSRSLNILSYCGPIARK
ncbi:methionine aminopeptidase 2 [Paracoccidioides brasiliensis Pb03]|nr:methionine aminopeptidase 2 [Paracoccidioides brasiliensis Pb03]